MGGPMVSQLGYRLGYGQSRFTSYSAAHLEHKKVSQKTKVSSVFSVVTPSGVYNSRLHSWIVSWFVPSYLAVLLRLLSSGTHALFWLLSQSAAAFIIVAQASSSVVDTEHGDTESCRPLLVGRPSRVPNALSDVLVKYTSTVENPCVVFVLEIPTGFCCVGTRLYSQRKLDILSVWTTAFQEE